MQANKNASIPKSRGTPGGPGGPCANTLIDTNVNEIIINSSFGFKYFDFIYIV
ncbi:MAG: hypothetical protein HRT72_08540 [Flavobacteriales bacterium]|nr:hypothetical protein [Flavobacteriales bacterium]